MRMHVPLRPMDPEVLSLECASLCAWSLEDIDASLWLSFLQAVVSEDSVPVDQFVEHMLPSLLSLAADPVPNVRVLLAKALRQTLLEKGVWPLPTSKLTLAVAGGSWVPKELQQADTQHPGETRSLERWTQSHQIQTVT